MLLQMQCVKCAYDGTYDGTCTVTAACGPHGSLKETLSRADAFANKICRNSS